MNTFVEYNGIRYKILKEVGLGYRKRVYMGEGEYSGQRVLIFYPTITEKFKSIRENNVKFKEDIYNLKNFGYKEIDPIYISETELVIVCKYIEGIQLYKFLYE